MCDLRTFRRIERAIEASMAEGLMFTAFDITLALQRKGIRKRHREIRRDIRSLADNLMYRYGYEQTRVRFREVGAEALVYHPYGADATRHRPSVRPSALAPGKRAAAAEDMAQAGVSSNQPGFAGMPHVLDHAFGLSLEGEPEFTLDVASGLIIISTHDPDVN
jgi:hypothetical protein